MRSLLAEYGETCTAIGWIDFHTGLGPSGFGAKICVGDVARARRWWGADVTSPLDGTSIAADVAGPLLDTLRQKLDLTGAKRVCDRGTCGACTVIVNSKVSYACSILAIDAVGKKIETIESLTSGSKPHPIVPAFVNNDAQQCGYCTPGFVMASKGFLDRNPKPTYEQVKEGLGGNLCRCGTYVGVRQAVLEAAKNL